MSCELAHLDGAYVLGALSPTERLRFEAHLAGCAECGRSVRELAGMPGLLAQVDVADIEVPVVDAPVPPTLLPSLVREVRGAQRRRSVVTAAVAAAVAAALAAVAVGSFALDRRDGRSPVAVPAPSATASTGAVERAMSPVGATAVRASVAMTSVPWGTRLDLTCSYATDSGGYDSPVGTTAYALVVRTRDGGVEQVGTWRPLPGRTMHLSAGTATRRDDITAVEMRTAAGRVVMRLST